MNASNESGGTNSIVIPILRSDHLAIRINIVIVAILVTTWTPNNLLVYF